MITRLLLLACLTLTIAWTSPTATNEWRPLFDGETFNGWQRFGQSGPPTQGWRIEDGILKKIRGERGGNLATVETFEEFELVWEWRIPTGANNGVKYFVVPRRGASIGHEYQMIDDRKGGNGIHQTASFYDVLAPRPDRPATRIDAWNTSRILVQGQRVEHWMNGEKVLEYELGSPEVLAAVGRSKFKSVPQFGTRVDGHILLTDHNDEAWFRNIRIRETAE